MTASAVTERNVREIETVASMVAKVMMHLMIKRLDKRFSEDGGAFVFKGLAGSARLSCGGCVSWIKAPGGAEVYNGRRGFVIEDLNHTRFVTNQVLNELMSIYRQVAYSA